MNKTELVAEMAGKAGLSKKDAEKALAAFVETVGAAMKAGEKVQLIGFGTFEKVHRDERQARNPSSGEYVTIPPTDVPKFKAGKALKDLMNS